MLIKTLPVGMLATNCYIVTDEDSMKCAIIDPGADSTAILNYIESNRLTPEAVFLTHGHFDHHMALESLLEVINVHVYLSEKDVDRSGQTGHHMINHNPSMTFCREGDEINVGNLTFTVLETPGHSRGSITLMCEDALFTGDTLFCGDCGRTDLEGGDRETMLKSLCRLAELEGDFEVYPGHEESTTLEAERRHNFDMKIALGIIS